MNKEFSITFWIRLDKNPKWVDRFSDIDFSPINKEGIQVYFTKRKEKFVVYILHPVIGYRKVTANIKNYLNIDAFIALTNSGDETKLYINADLLKTVEADTLIENVDIGDYIMLKIERGNITKQMAQNVGTLIVPAKIISFEGNNVIADLITIGEIIKVPKSQIKI
jgi:hypothetical protein